MKEKIAIVYGGPSSESAVSNRSAENVYQALKTKKYDVIKIELTQNIAEDLKREQIEKVYLITHGSPGEDGSVQGLLELLQIPYTGSGILASAVTFDKKKTKEILAYNNLPVLEDRIVSKQDNIDEKLNNINLKFPVIIKPNKEGSSVGIYIVQDKSELKDHIKQSIKKYDSIMIEEFISGTEITVGVLEDDHNFFALPILELVPHNEFYDFEAKYTDGMTDFIVPARLSESLTKKIQEIAVKAFKVIDGRSCGRVDFIIKDDKFWILEINSIPGMTSTSDLPQEAKAFGLEFEDLVEKILMTADLKG